MLYTCCCALLCDHPIFGIIFKRKPKLVALLLLSYRCIVSIYFLWLFLAVPWVGLQCVILVFPDRNHLFFGASKHNKKHIIQYGIMKRRFGTSKIYLSLNSSGLGCSLFLGDGSVIIAFKGVLCLILAFMQFFVSFLALQTS